MQVTVFCIVQIQGNELCKHVSMISVTMKSLLRSFSLLEVWPLGEVVGLLSGTRENISVMVKLHPNHSALRKTRLLLERATVALI